MHVQLLASVRLFLKDVVLEAGSNHLESLLSCIFWQAKMDIPLVFNEIEILSST